MALLNWQSAEVNISIILFGVKQVKVFFIGKTKKHYFFNKLMLD